MSPAHAIDWVSRFPNQAIVKIGSAPADAKFADESALRGCGEFVRVGDENEAFADCGYRVRRKDRLGVRGFEHRKRQLADRRECVQGTGGDFGSRTGLSGDDCGAEVRRDTADLRPDTRDGGTGAEQGFVAGIGGCGDARRRKAEDVRVGWHTSASSAR